jgi:hypothetical protein
VNGPFGVRASPRSSRASGTAQPVRGLDRSVANNTIRLELDGQTYLQQTFELAGKAELYALHEDASAEKVAETERGDFWFLGRVRSAAAAAE